MPTNKPWTPPQLEGRDDVVDADVVDEERETLQRRLDTYIYSLESGSIGNDGLRVLDELEQATRMDDPEARYRYLEDLSVHGIRRLHRHLRTAVDEHEQRAQLLSRFVSEIGQHLHATAEGDDPAMLPTPARAEAPMARAR